ncbi:MAG: phosphatase PAP2 family protein [Bacilli bacterium]
MISKVLKENLIYLILLILLIISFVLLFNSSLYDNIELIDYKVFEIMSNIANDNLTFVFKIFTFLGDFYIPIIIIVCLFLNFQNKIYAYLLSFSYLFTGMVTFIIKSLILRSRPTIALIMIPKSYSFPSGHTLTSFVFYIVLCYLLTIKSEKRVKILSYLLTLLLVILIGFSRVYLGVHFFSDVIGGLIIGIITLVLIISIIRKNFKEKL